MKSSKLKTKCKHDDVAAQWEKDVLISYKCSACKERWPGPGEEWKPIEYRRYQILKPGSKIECRHPSEGIWNNGVFTGVRCKNTNCWFGIESRGKEKHVKTSAYDFYYSAEIVLDDKTRYSGNVESEDDRKITLRKGRKDRTFRMARVVAIKRKGN